MPTQVPSPFGLFEGYSPARRICARGPGAIEGCCPATHRTPASLPRRGVGPQANCLLRTLALSGGLHACGDPLKNGMQAWLTAILKSSKRRSGAAPLTNGMQAWLTAILKSSKRRLGAAPLKNGMQAWLTAIAAVLVEAGFSRSEAARRSEGALVQIQGALVVSRCLQSEKPFQRTLRGLPSTLMGQYSETP